MVIKMLNIEQKGEGTVALTGRLDTVTAPQLETVLDGILPNTESLVLDLCGLEYISSAGLRLLLKAQKVMSKKRRHETASRQRRNKRNLRYYRILEFPCHRKINSEINDISKPMRKERGGSNGSNR